MANGTRTVSLARLLQLQVRWTVVLGKPHTGLQPTHTVYNLVVRMPNCTGLQPPQSCRLGWLLPVLHQTANARKRERLSQSCKWLRLISLVKHLLVEKKKKKKRNQKLWSKAASSLTTSLSPPAQRKLVQLLIGSKCSLGQVPATADACLCKLAPTHRQELQVPEQVPALVHEHVVWGYLWTVYDVNMVCGRWR